jgi:hypothetical protein
MSNQFLKAQEQGLEPGDEGYPDGANQFTTGNQTEHPEQVRQRIRAGVVARFLESVVEDGAEKTSDRVAAAKILFDKTLPSLSSIDQVNHDGDMNNPEQTKAKLRMLISKCDPALLSQILGELAKANPGLEVGKDADQAA